MNRRILVSIGTIVIAAMVVAGCAPRMAAVEPSYDMAAEAPAMSAAGEAERASAVDEGAYGGAKGSYATVERLIIQNASLELVVSDAQETVDAITDLTDALGGWVVESSIYKYQEGARASMILRIPADELKRALQTIGDMALEVRSENVSGQEVTDEYVDLTSDLRNLEAVEKELLELLTEVRERTGKAEDILAVHRELTSIRAEIERIKGRMNYLEESAAYSQVSIELIPDELAQPIQVGRWTPGSTLRNAIERLIRIMQWLVDAFIVILLNVVPVLVVIAIPIVAIIYAIRAIRKRRRARRARAPGGAEPREIESAE